MAQNKKKKKKEKKKEKKEEKKDRNCRESAAKAPRKRRESAAKAPRKRREARREERRVVCRLTRHDLRADRVLAQVDSAAAEGRLVAVEHEAAVGW
jgi:hypothetical protein